MRPVEGNMGDRIRKSLRARLGDSLYRNALYLIASQAVTAVVGLVFWVLAARYYEAEAVGLGSGAVSAMMLLALLATLGLDYAIIRFLPGSGRDAGRMVNSSLTLAGAAAVVMALLFIAGVGVWSPALLFLRQSPAVLFAFVGFTALWTLSMIITRTFVAARRSGFALAQAVVFNAVRLCLIVVLSAYFAAFGIFGAWGLAGAAAVLAASLLFMPRLLAGYVPRPAIGRQLVRKMLRFSLANYAAVLLWMAPTYILPLLVVNLVGAAANAYFYIAWAIANVLFSIPLAASFSLFAEGSHDAGRLGGDARKSLALTFAILAPMIVLLLFLGDRILLIFDAAYAENAAGLLRLLVVSALPLSLNHIFFGVRRVEMRMRSVILLNAFIAVATIVLSWVLLPRIGIAGAGIAWLSSQGVAAVIVAVSWAVSARKRAPAG